MATTTNYSWSTPDDTALVKDGAAAIRTLGSSIDTTTKALNPSTTLGDLEYRSATANTNTRLGIGTTGQVLTVSGGVPSWAAVAAGGMTLLASGTLSGTSLSLSSIAQTYTDLQLYISGANIDFNSEYNIRFNNDTNSVYTNTNTFTNGSSNSTNVTGPVSKLKLNSTTTKTAGGNGNIFFTIPNYAVSKAITTCNYVSGYFNNSDAYEVLRGAGIYFPASATAINRIDLLTGGSDVFTAGNYALYGVK